MKRIGKKGSSHLEIIIAFVLFVGFSLFLMMYLQPTQKNTLEGSILFGLKNEFFDNTVSNVTIAMVKKANATEGTGDCWEGDLCRPKEITNTNAIGVPIDGQDDCYYYVYASDEFEGIDGLSKCVEKNYTLGYIEVQIVYSNKSLQEISRRYHEEYDGLKMTLGVPQTVDFAITSNNYSLNKQVPQDVEAIAGVYRKPVLYANGSIINQDFIIKIW